VSCLQLSENFSMTKSVAAHITLIAMAHLILGGVTLAQVSPQLALKARDASALTDAAQQQGHVRIIVQFSAPTLADQPTRDAAAIATVKTQIASIQDTIIASHFGNATNPTPGAGFPRGLLRFDITPMFAVNASKAELDALAADPLVTTIHLDRANQPTLLQSVPLIGMTTAYTLGATGAGQAVAVVDTGVQSNHEFVVGKVVMEACFSNSGGGAGGFSLCPNGQSSQSGTGAADPTTAECINGANSLCIHGTHVAGIAAGLNTSQSTGEPSLRR
jgi:serine protease